MRHPVVGLLASIMLAGTAACGPSMQASGESQTAEQAQGPISPTPVSHEQFASSTYKIIVDGERSPERTNLLAGVVRRQLQRAKQRFSRGHADAGLAAVTGALYLLRAGELHPQMLENGAPALRAAAAEVARVGDEGAALALYGMLEEVLPAGREKKDVERHLAALENWSQNTRSEGPMQAAAGAHRAAVHRSLYAATRPALKDAREETIAWITAAMDSNVAELPIRSNFERDEAISAYRAIRAGGASLVAVYLRHGDARGALNAIDGADLTQVVPPGLRDRLERAAEDDDPGAWADLFQLFDSAEGAGRPETSLDPVLAEAGAWGAALELYRSEPNTLRGAQPLSVALVNLGMAEVAPLVLGAALAKNASAYDVSWAMNLLLRAIVSEDQVSQLAAARRTFEAGRPIVELAKSEKLAGRVRPSAARLHFVMGALETRGGKLSRALPHIQAAASQEPTPEAYGLLAAIHRQSKDYTQALEALGKVEELAKAAGDPAAEAEAHLSSFEIFRAKADPSRAEAELRAALERALDARQLARSGSARARAERTLARVLEQYGDDDGVRRATQRAYDASRSDLQQLTATVLDAARRALTRLDLSAGREAVRNALEAGLADEDMVYVALWLHLLEKELGKPSDGTTEEAFATVDEASGWPATLRAWGRGKLSDEQLIQSARSEVERTEAAFYVAMSKRASGNSAWDELSKVASSEAIELVEVTIARDLVARHRSKLELSVPDSIDVP